MCDLPNKKKKGKAIDIKDKKLQQRKKTMKKKIRKTVYHHSI
jgi:hypothetical protein